MFFGGGGEVGGSEGLTDILVVHVAQQLDLPQRALGVDLVVEGVGDLLDGHLLPRLGVERRAAGRESGNESVGGNAREGIYSEEGGQGEGRRKGGVPDDAVGALADGEDGGLVLDGDLEDVAEDVVLDEPPAVAERGLDVVHGRRPAGRRRLPGRRPGLGHLRVRRLRPAVHGRVGIARGGVGGRRGEKRWWWWSSLRDLVAFRLLFRLAWLDRKSVV